ncbi:hypothetical protein, partial [Bosea sp. WAO]|uniref:hypothetical protein n=1 Tax=Bosea sp. WAO TaxID=406341 RepID=UPI001AECDCE8
PDAPAAADKWRRVVKACTEASTRNRPPAGAFLRKPEWMKHSTSQFVGGISGIGAGLCNASRSAPAPDQQS